MNDCEREVILDKSFTGVHSKKNIFQERRWTTVIFTELSFWERVFVCDNIHIRDNMHFTDNMHFIDNKRRTSLFTRS